VCQEKTGLVVTAHSCSHHCVTTTLRADPPLCSQRLTVSLTLLVLTLLAGCGPAPVAQSLEVVTSGTNKEQFRWTTEDPIAAGKHQLYVSSLNDPAKLMGWTSGARTYRAVVKLKLEGPKGILRENTLYLPISELKPVGESADGQTEFIAPTVSGNIQPSGMHQTTPVWAFSFPAEPGTWTLDATLMAPHNTDRRALQVVRRLQLETRSRSKGERQLTGWSIAPPTDRNEADKLKRD
jgi:hypothetical protein